MLYKNNNNVYNGTHKTITSYKLLKFTDAFQVSIGCGLHRIMSLYAVSSCKFSFFVGSCEMIFYREI